MVGFHCLALWMAGDVACLKGQEVASLDGVRSRGQHSMSAVESWCVEVVTGLGIHSFNKQD